MSWQEFKEMVYYVLLKRGQVLIAVLGLVVAILVYLNATKYGLGVAAVTQDVITTCQADTECFEYCGRCVSVAGTRNCEPNFTVVCGCVEGNCQNIT
jgi:hypothetical protein